MTLSEKTFISNLKTLRRYHSLKQKEMAAILKVKLSRYSSWEEQRAFPALDYLFKIAAFFQYDLKTLCEDIIPLEVAA